MIVGRHPILISVVLPTDRELMRMHVNALFTRNGAGDLLAVNDPGGRAAPRLFIGQTGDSTLLRFRYDLDVEARRQVELQAADIVDLAQVDPLDFEAVLKESGPVQRTWRGPVFVFENVNVPSSAVAAISESNADLLDRHLAAWRDDVKQHRPLYAVLVEGHAVSVCCSVRITSAAHEADVETVPEFRGRGYAARAVAVWSKAVRAAGSVPFYSTSWQNEASQAVAARLGLRCFGTDLHIT
jgi:hypothetical protein